MVPNTLFNPYPNAANPVTDKNPATKVVAVANDLAEAVSEVETVADELNEAA